MLVCLQYAILLTIVFTVLVKYTLHCIDLYDENPWENKAVYLLYLELLTSKYISLSQPLPHGYTVFKYYTVFYVNIPDLNCGLVQLI